MTLDRDEAIKALVAESVRYNAHYLYRLPSGFFYASPTPPSAMNHELVAVAARGALLPSYT